jgi:plastocyanin
MRKLAAALVVAGLLVALVATLAFAGTRRVGVQDNLFTKTSVTIKKGSAVKWVWENTSNSHNVTGIRGTHIHSATKSSGSFSHTFRRRGTYKFICTVHPSQMRMTVRVL